MPLFDVTKPEVSGSTEKEWVPFETGEYVMRIADAKIAPSNFPDEDGNHPEEFTVRWELDEWRSEFDETGYMQKQAVFQHMRPWYGESRRGPSKFKEFVDTLVKAGLVPEQAEDVDVFLGIRARVLVQRYTKGEQAGINKGKPGNKVVGVAPIKNGKPAAALIPTPEGEDSQREYFHSLFLQVKNGEVTDRKDLLDYADELGKAAGEPFNSRDRSEYTTVRLKHEIETYWREILRQPTADPDSLF